MCHASCHMLAGSTPQSAAWADLTSQRWRGKLWRNFANFKKPTCVRSERLRAAWCFMTQHKTEQHLIYWICKLEFEEGSRFTVIFSLTSYVAMRWCCASLYLSFWFLFSWRQRSQNKYFPAASWYLEWTLHNIHLLSSPNLDLYHFMCLKKTRRSARISVEFLGKFIRDESVLGISSVEC